MLCSLVRTDRVAVGVLRKLAPFNEFIARGIKCQSGALHAQSAAAETGKYKTIDDLPGPSLMTTAYWLFIKGYADKSHAMQVKHGFISVRIALKVLLIVFTNVCE